MSAIVLVSPVRDAEEGAPPMDLMLTLTLIRMSLAAFAVVFSAICASETVAALRARPRAPAPAPVPVRAAAARPAVARTPSAPAWNAALRPQ